MLSAWLAAVTLFGCHGEEPSSGKTDAGSAPAVTLYPELDPSENQIPGHPGFVEFVYPDSHSEIVPAVRVPDSVKFVDGKPIVKIVNTGQCILQYDVHGNELRATMRGHNPNPSSR
jgi:hypothetical protein